MNERLNVTTTSARGVADPSEAAWVVRELLRLRASADVALELNGAVAADGEAHQ